MKKLYLFLFAVLLISLVSADPNISFVSPTPADQSHSVNTYIYVNVSYNSSNLVNVTFNLLDSNEVAINSSTYLTPINDSNYTGLTEGVYLIQVIVYDNTPSISLTEMRKLAVSNSGGTYIQPFDFYTILVGYFLGNASLILFAILILVSLLCGYFGVPNIPATVILAIVSLMFGAYIGEAYYTLILLVVGFFMYRAFARIFQ